MRYKKFLLTVIFITAMMAGIFALGESALAQGAGTVGGHLQAFGGEQGAGLPAPANPILAAALIIRFVLGTLGVIFLGLIIYAGILWMTAGGNDEQVGKAKTLVTNAVIGLLIVLSAYSITLFVFRGVTQNKRSCNSDKDCVKGSGKCNNLGRCIPDTLWCDTDTDCDPRENCLNNECKHE